MNELNLYEIKYTKDDIDYVIKVEAMSFDWALLVLDRDTNITHLELNLIKRNYSTDGLYGARIIK
jgi:hypothetical protein